MKNAKAKITGIALLSMIALTGCDMSSPVAPAKESSIPSTDASPTTTPVKASPTNSPKVNKPETPQNKPVTYKEIKDVDIDLMLESYTDPKVFQVFPADEHLIDSGASIAVGWFHALHTYEGFYKPRKTGKDAEFFAKKEMRENINDRAYEIITENIAKNGRITLFHTADLKGEVCLCDGKPPVKLDGVPERTYGMPVMTVSKSSKNLDRLHIYVDTEVFFKGKEDSPNIKQNYRYHVFLSPSGKIWQVSGLGFEKVGASWFVNDQGDKL